MGADMQTPLGKPLSAESARQAAARYLTSTGNTDLLPILGLAVEVVLPRGDCPVCGKQLHSHGGCNRRKACREATHGLSDEVTSGRKPCPSCGKPLPDPITNGGHKPCQRRACPAGPAARGVKQ